MNYNEELIFRIVALVGAIISWTIIYEKYIRNKIYK